jgi:hypothetical protein
MMARVNPHPLGMLVYPASIAVQVIVGRYEVHVGIRE